MPITRPSRVIRRPTVKPISSEMREPQISWAKTSWPWPVVPSQCCAEGGWFWQADKRVGSPGAIKGAKIATRMKMARMTSPNKGLALADHAAQEIN